MGNLLCANQRSFEDRSMAISKSYFKRQQKSRKAVRSNSSDVFQNEKITCETYKQALIDLLEQQRKRNEKTSQRDFESYLKPLQETVDTANPQNYERLLLNLKSFKPKAQFGKSGIDDKSDDGFRNQQEEQDDLKNLLKDMVEQELKQIELRGVSKKSDYGSHLLCVGPALQTNTSSTTMMRQGQQSHLNKNINATTAMQNSNSVYSGGQLNRQNTTVMNMSMSMVQADLIGRTMADPFTNYDNPEIQIQKQLFNYLYGLVTCNQHIVKNLIDRFSETMQGMYRVDDFVTAPLEDFGQECFPSISDKVCSEVIFLMKLLSKYLDKIYGEQILESNFSAQNKLAIFDIFVGKVVFDNAFIYAISFNAIIQAMRRARGGLQDLFEFMAKKYTLEAVFQNSKNLAFMQYADLEFDIIEPVSKVIANIVNTSSPFLKLEQFKQIYQCVLDIFERIQKNLIEKKRLETQRMKFEINDFMQMYAMIIVHTFEREQLFEEIRFISSYIENWDRQNVFSNFESLFVDFVWIAGEGDRGKEYCGQIFDQEANDEVGREKEGEPILGFFDRQSSEENGSPPSIGLAQQGRVSLPRRSNENGAGSDSDPSMLLLQAPQAYHSMVLKRKSVNEYSKEKLEEIFESETEDSVESGIYRDSAVLRTSSAFAARKKSQFRDGALNLNGSSYQGDDDDELKQLRSSSYTEITSLTMSQYQNNSLNQSKLQSSPQQQQQQQQGQQQSELKILLHGGFPVSRIKENKLLPLELLSTQESSNVVEIAESSLDSNNLTDSSIVYSKHNY